MSTEKVQTHDRVTDFFAVLNLHLQKNYSSYIKLFLQPLISPPIARCPANFINLSAIIVDLQLAEYGSKLRRKTGSPCQKRNTENNCCKSLISMF